MNNYLRVQTLDAEILPGFYYAIYSS